MTATDHRQASGTECFPTSPVQAGLWFASTYGADPTAYNQPLVLRLRTTLDHACLLEALRVVHQDHGALRTTFEMDADGEVRQVVHRDLEPVLDVRDHADDHPEAWVAEQVAEVAGTVFDLRAGPLVRVRHLRLGAEGRSLLVFNIHHTVFDGMSWKPYLSQLEAVYTAVARGDEPPRRPRRQAVEAYARWSRRCADSATSRYWRDKLANAPAPTPIRSPGEGPARNVTRQLVLDQRVSARLRQFCAEEGLTTSMFFVALCFVLLHRQTRQDDVLLGMPVTVREGGDAEVVGHLTNTTVLRHRLAPGATARDVLGAVKREVLDVLRHRHAPLEAVVGELRAAGGDQGATSDLFNAIITVMPAAARRLDLREWGVRTWDYTPGGAKYDLALVVDEAPDHYTLIVEHTSDSADDRSTATYLARRLETLVHAVIADQDVAVADLRWLGDEERRAITELCARRADAPTLGTEVTAELFASAVAAAGARPAVVADGVATSYAELAGRVDALAASLAARGVRDGQPVAVLMRPGLDLVTTVLGILRAGGSYVTFDVDHPRERLSFALRDCGARVLVSASDVDLAGVPPPDGLDIVDPSEPDSAAAPVAGRRKTPEDPAYTVYTSGSTGRPKGVVLPETTLTNLVRNQATMSSGRRMRTLQYMSPAFDVFAEELFGTLCTGGTLVIPPAHARTDFEALAEVLAEQRVERAFFPYVALRELAAVLRTSTVELPDLREVYVTGERLVVTDDLRAMFRRYRGASLSNIYGPSEAHLCSEEKLPADPDTWPTIPAIGRVVAGVDARVLVDGDRLAPFGVEGELCVAGPVVSPGYLGLPDRTRRAMVPDPFVPGQLMYRTGDVVVLAPDGRLHYRGRADDQVKIRGYRVEPGEVEAALERVLDVDAAAVIAVSTGADRALHAFVRCATEPPPDWPARLGTVLPGYMIPRRLTRVEAIPVTPTGKTDRRALESWLARHGAPEPAEDVADHDWSDSERVMAELWTEVLGHPPTAPDVDFFVLGGHSLLAARLHRLVRRRLRTDVPLSALLSTPTVRGMAERLDDRGDSAAPDLRDEARLHDLVVGERREPVEGTVLLTGATGFLGGHLLDELLRTGRRVCCLVRAGSAEDGRDRLRRTFEKFALDPARLDEVDIRPGDLAEPRFGLGEQYESLARAASEVYHAAAHINFVVPYHTVKRTNVDGLRHLLDFCGVNRTPLRLISTMGVFPPDSTSDVVGEDAVPGDPASLGIGYSQSKWVAEHLALRARAAGLPVAVHRVGRIAGHSRTHGEYISHITVCCYCTHTLRFEELSDRSRMPKGRAMSSANAPGDDPDSRVHRTTTPWRGLALLTFPLIVLALDVSVLFLAAPALTRDLGASPAQVLWITDIYGFFIAGFLIVMGVLGDRVGRRRLLVVGCLAFAAASTLAAFAPTAELLIVARALLGLAGATLMPSTLALIRVLFPDEVERQKAIAVWMMTFSASVAIGPVLGGFVIDQFWWGAVFLFPVPLLVAFAVLSHRLLPERRENRTAPLDLVSVVLIATAMLGTAYTVKAVAVGDAHPGTLVVLGLAVVAGVLAVRRQFRTEHPLVEPALLTNRRLLAALALLLMSVTAVNGFYFLVPQYFQHVQGRSAASTGLLMLPLALAAVVSSLAVPPLLRFVRPPVLVAGCAVLSGAGFVVLVFQRGPLGVVTLTVLGCAIAAGISALGVVMTDLVVGVAPPEHAGAAAGLSETSGELGVALGVAVMGSVYVFAYRRSVLADPAEVDGDIRTAVADSIAGARGLAERAGEGRAETILDVVGRGFGAGLSWAAAVGATAMALCALLATTSLRTARTPSDHPSEQPADERR